MYAKEGLGILYLYSSKASYAIKTRMIAIISGVFSVLQTAHLA